MSKCTTYGVSKVGYEDSSKKGDEFISKVEVYCCDETGNWSDEGIMDVGIVIDKIENGDCFITIIGDEPKFVEGAKVIVKTNEEGKKYISTTPDGSKENNLGSLPTIENKKWWE